MVKARTVDVSPNAQTTIQRPAAPARASGVSVWLSFIAVTIIGFLQNDSAIAAALWPPNWGPEKNVSYSALAFVGLVAGAGLLAWRDHTQRQHQDARYRESLEQAETARAAERQEAEKRIDTLLSETKALRDAVSDAERRREEAEGRARDIDQELLTRTNSLEASIRTLPPAKFLEGFDEASRDSHNALLIVLRTPRAQRRANQILDAIRYVLFAAANLVKNFEGNPVGTLYTANIMVFVPSTALTAALEQDLRNHLIVSDLFPDLRKIRGLLDLRTEFTVSTASSLKLRPDEQVRRLVLPVPARYSETEGLFALPGAPTAFCRKSMDVCPNVFDLPARCVREHVLPESSRERFRAYFHEQIPHIRSFVSLPLVSSYDSENPRGVVNINCSTTGLLRERARQEIILPNLRSLLWNLPEMIEEYDSTPLQRRRSQRHPNKKK